VFWSSRFVDDARLAFDVSASAREKQRVTWIQTRVTPSRGGSAWSRDADPDKDSFCDVKKSPHKTLVLILTKLNGSTQNSRSNLRKAGRLDTTLVLVFAKLKGSKLKG
jgi:hypothetical protein